MNDLIEALTILKTYLADPNALSPLICMHDILLVMDVTQEQVSEDDQGRLEELSFFWNEEYDCWASYRFGSA